MEYTRFKEDFMKKLKMAVEGDGVEIIEHQTQKNNGLKVDCLLVKIPDSEVGMNIRLSDCYADYVRGKSIGRIANEWADVVREHISAKIQTPVINRQTAEVGLYATVVNAATNQDLLADTPHRRIEDLAVVPRIRLTLNNGAEGSFVVQNQHLSSLLQMTKDEVLNIAVANTEKNGFVCMSMEKYMLGALSEASEDGEAMMDELFPEENVMYIVSNKEMVHGAAVLACSKGLERAMDQVGEDCYVLPASIHEAILVPKSKCRSLDELKEIVESVNQTEVMPDEILSNNVYEVNQQTKRLQIASGAELKEAVHINRSKAMRM